MGLVPAARDLSMSIPLYRRRLRHSWCVVSAILTLGGAARPLHAAEENAVAIYHFDEKQGDVVRDSSPHHFDGRIVGGAAWAGKGIAGNAVLFNGRNRIRIPSAPQLEFSGAHAVTAWIRGRSSATHFVEGFPDLRAPFYQVCGDTLYLATNSDAYANDADKTAGSLLRAKDIYHIYTGSADTGLGGWNYLRQTTEPLSGFEPRLQVVGNKIYYEYTGTADSRKANQIWTAESALDGSNWHALMRTNSARYDLLPPNDGRRDTLDVDRALYRNDHGQISVAGKKIYIAYPAQDENQVWQLWTAVSNLDGSNYRAFQRTTDRGWIPSGIQTAGNRVYYLYPKGDAIFETYSHNQVRGTATTPKTVEGFYVGSTDLAGEDWKVVKRIGGPGPSGDSSSFYISNGRIYLVWVEFEPDGSGRSRLFTGDMDMNGGDYRQTQRSDEKGNFGTPISGGVQVVGNRLYYVFGKRVVYNLASEPPANPPRSSPALAGALPPGTQVSLWTAECNLDGSGWLAQPVGNGAQFFVGYKGLVVVGAKRYLAPGRPGMIGFGGANLVNKGDAYGLGLTEAGRARGFVNAGQDFLYRGEAAIDTSGAIADARDALTHDNWYHVAAVYDRQHLQLYVNGSLTASTPYQAPAGKNPFPVVIGDGFIGAMEEVRLYDRALSAEEIMKQYRQFR